ncbi:MAG: hypothetical protein WCT50_01590 [Patescibacteria group bacterium]
MPGEKKLKRTIKIDKKNSSGLSAFTQRPMPTENEVANFEKVVEREARHQEIDSNLTEIYRDKKGGLVDVKIMKVKKRQLFVIKMFKRLLVISLLSLIAAFCYFYFFARGNDMNGLEFSISAPEKVKVGEEFSYKIEYSNPTKFGMNQIRLELKYPENFIYSSSSLSPLSGNYGFSLPNISSGAQGSFIVTGMIIAPVETVQIISGRLSYVPLNFSSEFKKESSDATIVSGIGFQVGIESSNTAFVNQDNELNISFFDIEDNLFGDFNLEFILPSGATISTSTPTTTITSPTDRETTISSSGSVNNWLISGLVKGSANKKINFKYQIKDQPVDTKIIVRLEKILADGKKYLFWEQTLNPEIIKSDLNLTLFLNGSKNNGAVSFGDTLSYTLNYSNKGQNIFKDAVIMAVLDGAFLDWNSLRAEQTGDVRIGKMIVWTKNDIPALAAIKPGDEGEINFTINLKNYKDSDFGKSLQLSSYSQYGVNSQESGDNKNKSNIIVTKINSDLSLLEEIRYFNDDNIPVGSGPLPPKVGEKSSFKVYWKVKNNLHELSGAQATFNLPNQVVWDDKSSVSVGSLYYDEVKRAVIWSIGRLPVSVYQVDASFSISVTPTISDQNKVLILSPGSVVTALDNETQAVITRKIESKTTKLEDDDIANLNNSGRVE